MQLQESRTLSELENFDIDKASKGQNTQKLMQEQAHDHITNNDKWIWTAKPRIKKGGNIKKENNQSYFPWFEDTDTSLLL